MRIILNKVNNNLVMMDKYLRHNHLVAKEFRSVYPRFCDLDPEKLKTLEAFIQCDATVEQLQKFIRCEFAKFFFFYISLSCNANCFT